MKKLLMNIYLIGLFSLAAVNVKAEDLCLSVDGGFHYSQMKSSQIKGADNVGFGMLIAKLDCYFSKDFALQVRMGWNTTDKGNEFSLDSISGIYGKGIFYSFEKVNIYGTVGVTYGTFSRPDFERGYVTRYTNNFSYGLGVEINLYKNSYLLLEYADYLSQADIHITALEIGLSLKM